MILKKRAYASFDIRFLSFSTDYVRKNRNNGKVSNKMQLFYFNKNKII